MIVEKIANGLSLYLAALSLLEKAQGNHAKFVEAGIVAAVFYAVGVLTGAAEK